MKSEQIEIGMKVTPFQKTASGWEEDISKYKSHNYGNGKFLKENGYLYVVEYDGYEEAWVLNEDKGEGDFFNPEDFEPYIEGYDEEDKGFEIKCLDCGSTNCEVYEDGDYGYEEEWVSWGYRIRCKDCGQTD